MLTQAALHGFRWSAVFWRPMLVLAVTAALAFNLLSGTYSGIVHAHAHDHAEFDHHRDDHAADHDADRDDGDVTPASRTVAGGGITTLDQSHEHPADVVLNLPNLVSCTYGDSQEVWSPPRPATVAIHEFGPSERPPRNA